jgi:histidyl-tRNA synthetase
MTRLNSYPESMNERHEGGNYTIFKPNCPKVRAESVCYNFESMANIQPLKGTRDFYPEEMAIRTWLYNTVRDISESFGYQEYETPCIETLELYAAKSGEELVKEQSFVFPDRGGNLITLRPELTPSLARMIAQRQRQLTFPLRWWSWGPIWRYEKPQKGRGREFFQWNIDLIGVDSPAADAEIVAIAAMFFKKVGLTPGEVNILVGNRRLMDAQFQSLAIPTEQRPAVLKLIDRREKMSPEQWENHAAAIGLRAAQVEGLKARLADYELWRESPELVQFFEIIQSLGLSETVRFAPHIIRGLQYYTGTVFEAWDVSGEFRALFGGGRYDNLVADVGGEPLPGTGFAMGDMVITLLLEKLGRLPQGLNQSPAGVLVTVFDAERLPASFALAAELREAGLNVACYPAVDKLSKQFKYADRIGTKVVIVLGPDELAQGTVTVKNLMARVQQSIPRSEVPVFIQQILRPE